MVVVFCLYYPAFAPLTPPLLPLPTSPLPRASPPLSGCWKPCCTAVLTLLRRLMLLFPLVCGGRYRFRLSFPGRRRCRYSPVLLSLPLIGVPVRCRENPLLPATALQFTHVCDWLIHSCIH